MAVYSIKDLEKISGIKAHTIRIWEKRYTLINPDRTDTNIRLYSDNDLRKILNVSILIRNGFKISKIAALKENEITDKVLIFSQTKSDVAAVIEHLLSAMFDLDEHKFEHIISNQILNIGFEEAFVKIIYPFFERIGVLWQAGSVVPAQEHFVSNIIRQKLIVAIDSLHSADILNKQFVLFLPEGEYHELGLLFYSYMLKKRGFKVIYLGQSVPLNNLLSINATQQADYFLFSVNTSLTKHKVEEIKQFFQENISTTAYVFGIQSYLFLNDEKKQFFQINSTEKFINLIQTFQGF